MIKSRHKALLLLGPTGSGKTPLGDMCGEKGLWGRTCAHFDFGASLRARAAKGPIPPHLTGEDIDVIVNVLRSGALLTNDNFHIAQAILQLFAEENLEGEDGILLLNGLPRHIGQAEDVDDIVDVTAVLHLICTPVVVGERIKHDTGGDRAGRIDDSPEEIARKLKLFDERTLPLIEHYRGKNAGIEEYKVSVATSADDIYEWLNSRSNYVQQTITYRKTP